MTTTKRPVPASETVSAVMKRVRTKNSKPEVLIRKVLHEMGLRYRLHRKDLPGRPDVVFGPAKVAVFVDGCFWHHCPEHGTLPKNNREWWAAKFKRTRERDREKDEQLKALGWLPVHVWEHEDPYEAATRIAGIVKSRRNSRVSSSR